MGDGGAEGGLGGKIRRWIRWEWHKKREEGDVMGGGWRSNATFAVNTNRFLRPEGYEGIHGWGKSRFESFETYQHEKKRGIKIVGVFENGGLKVRVTCIFVVHGVNIINIF